MPGSHWTLGASYNIRFLLDLGFLRVMSGSCWTSRGLMRIFTKSKLVAIGVAQDVLIKIVGQTNAKRHEKLIFKIQTARMGIFCNLPYRAHLKGSARLPRPQYVVDASRQ